MKRMHSFERYNPLPDLINLIPESGITLSEQLIINICTLFFKGGILIEDAKDFDTILTLLSKEYNLIKIENNTLTLTR